MMASAAAFRDDIAGAIATGGTSTAYTVTSSQIFDTLAHMSGQVIAFTPHTTNGATVTLNVDGLGAKPLRSAPSVELPAGVLVQGTPYTALYNNSDAVWYLHNFFVNPYQVPLGGFLDYAGSTAPNSAFVLPYGQAISRTTYATLFSLISTTYGTGDGSTTFNVPDLRGRVVAGKDDMGGSAASRITTTVSPGGTSLGATGGSQTHSLVTAELPAYTPSGTVSGTFTASNPLQAFTGTSFSGSNVFATNANGTNYSNYTATGTISATFTGTAQGGISQAINMLQPTILLNKILRVI
jgi:microcystin-dependent protein